MEVNGQLQTPAALSPDYKPPMSTLWWAPEPVPTLPRKEKFLPFARHYYQVFLLQNSHYTD